MEKAHIESGNSVYMFTDEFLVECPKCQAMAIVRRTGSALSPELVTLACSVCGHNQSSDLCDWPGSTMRSVDLYFCLPLWLRTRCCGEELWAFNREHLEQLESFIKADHRKRAPKKANSLTNRTFESRLPKWIKSSKNREELLRGIQRLKMKLPRKET